MTKSHNIPLVIIGLDAGDPYLIEKWTKEGYLPNIKSIMQNGSWGFTSDTELISEHGVWLSFSTGISRIKHGYYYFRQLKPGTYDLVEVNGIDLSIDPFWHYLNNEKVFIIDVPDCKIVQGLNGIQLVNWDVHNSANPKSHKLKSSPQDFANQITKKFGSQQQPIENLDSSYSEDIKLVKVLGERIKSKGNLCNYIIAKDFYDFVFICFSQMHAVGHQFWKYNSLTINNDNSDGLLSTAIRDVYCAIDIEIGRILKKLGNNSNIFIISSVGIEDDFPISGLTDSFLTNLGYRVPVNNSLSLKPIDILRKVIPESLRVTLSSFLPRNIRESILAQQFRNNTNWSKTRAFSIPSYYTSFIRINLKNREPNGIVRHGTEYFELLNQIENDLNKLVDPENNRPVVKEIKKTVEIFNCDQFHNLPDMFVEWKPGKYLNQIQHPDTIIKQKKPDFFRRSDHSGKGIFAACGPNISSNNKIGNINILDFAPTFLTLMNVKIPMSIEGHVRSELIKN